MSDKEKKDSKSLSEKATETLKTTGDVATIVVQQFMDGKRQALEVSKEYFVQDMPASMKERWEMLKKGDVKGLLFADAQGIGALGEGLIDRGKELVNDVKFAGSVYFGDGGATPSNIPVQKPAQPEVKK